VFKFNIILPGEQACRQNEEHDNYLNEFLHSITPSVEFFLDCKVQRTSLKHNAIQRIL